MMNLRYIVAATLSFALLVLALTCDPQANETSPSEPELHPNSTSPDEQGESGSLIEPKKP